MSHRISLSIQIALRFLRSKSRGHFLSLVTFVSVLGVCIGVLALLLVTSVINGYEKELTSIISGTQGDVILFSRGSPVRDPENLELKLRQVSPELESGTASLVSQAMFSAGSGVAGGVLEGVDLERWGSVISIQERIKPGGALLRSGNEIMLGSSLAERIGAEVGGTIRVTLPFTGTDDEGGYGSPRVQDFTVTAILHFGMHDYDSKYAFAPLAPTQEFVFGDSTKHWINTLRFRVKKNTEPYEVAQKLSPHFGFPYRVIDWSQLNKNLLYAVRLEKAVIAVLLTAIMIVAAFNIVSALLLLVYEKEREISILRVLGSRRMDQFWMFSFVGSFFGLIGTFLATGLGFVLVQILKRVKWISLPADIYHLEYLPIVIRWTEWCAIGAMAFLICFLATTGPALQLSKRSPLEGLR